MLRNGHVQRRGSGARADDEGPHVAADQLLDCSKRPGRVDVRRVPKALEHRLGPGICVDARHRGQVPVGHYRIPTGQDVFHAADLVVRFEPLASCRGSRHDPHARKCADSNLLFRLRAATSTGRDPLHPHGSNRDAHVHRVPAENSKRTCVPTSVETLPLPNDPERRVSRLATDRGRWVQLAKQPRCQHLRHNPGGPKAGHEGLADATADAFAQVLNRPELLHVGARRIALERDQLVCRQPLQDTVDVLLGDGVLRLVLRTCRQLVR
eukprot:scaffold1410_cov242-Pinguiococcus_pyrenoidosus.AAC.14